MIVLYKYYKWLDKRANRIFAKKYPEIAKIINNINKK